MVWQDVVLTVGAVLFIIALIPAVRSREKPSIFTSFLSAAVLTSFEVVYISLEFWFALIVNGCLATLWFIIGLQKLSQSHKK